MKQMAEWVQDALDAIEYANGPVESRFGALRAKAGHPAPFHLKYMEIGNENGGPAYQERFPLFYDAIKTRYPQMTLIADEPTTRRRPDVVDEHYYSSPSFFIANAHKYDTYDRQVRGLRGRIRGHGGLWAGKPARRGRRGRVHDGHGAKRRRGDHGLLRPAVCQHELQEMEPRPDRFRQFAGLRPAFLLRAEDVQHESR